jgi:hypothetical protein
MRWATRISLLPVTATVVSLYAAGCAGRSPRAFDPSDRERIEPQVSLRSREVAASSARPIFADGAPALQESHADSDERSANKPSRTLGWVLFSIGAEGAIVAAITSFMMLHDKSVRDDNCDANKVCSQAGLAANAEIAALAWWNVGAWAVAGAGLSVGGLLVLMNPPAGAGRLAVGISPSGSGIGLGARGAF